MNTTQAPAHLFDSDVLDSSGKKIGTVDNVWVDEATRQPEFFGVKTGWLGLGKNHMIPAANAEVDAASGTIKTTYGEEQIKGAPSFGSQAELTADDENTIYSYYGIQRSTEPSPTGLPGSTGTSGTATAGTATSGTASGQAGGTSGQEDVRVPLTEEQLTVGKRQVEAGRARLRKVVRTEQAAEPIELRREELHVERVPASGTAVPGDAFQEREIDVTAMREEPVVSKQAQVTGEVRVGKTAETETRTVGDEVRKEEVEVDQGVDTASPPDLR